MTESIYDAVIPPIPENSPYINSVGFFNELNSCGLPASGLYSRDLFYHAGRALNRTGLYGRLANLRRKTHIVFVGYNQVRYFAPRGTLSQIIPWCLDTWPGEDHLLNRILCRYGVKRAAFGQRMSCERWRKLKPDVDFCWIPESANPEDYYQNADLSTRSMLLLEYGRGLPEISEQIKRSASHFGWSYSPVEASRQRYTSWRDLRVALGQSRAIIALPRSITHPLVAGGCETMSLRYLEGIASRTILLGQCPQELFDLFGFDPVIHVNKNNVVDILADIQNHPCDYQEHVDKCYGRFLEAGTHHVRARQLLRWIMKD